MSIGSINGLMYYKARYYSTDLGRFLQVDPIGYEDQMNMYAYVGNDPLNGIDPTGMCGVEKQRDGCSIKYDEVASQADPEASGTRAMLDAVPETGTGRDVTFDPETFKIGQERDHGRTVAKAVQGGIKGSSLAGAAKQASESGAPVDVSFVTTASPTNAIGQYAIDWRGTLTVSEWAYQISAFGTVRDQAMNWEFGGAGTNPIRDAVTAVMGAVGPKGTYTAVPNRTISGDFRGLVTRPAVKLPSCRACP